MRTTPRNRLQRTSDPPLLRNVDMPKMMTAKTSLLVIVGIGLALASVSAAAEYVVRPGDTLSGIASSQLGEAGRWSEIAKLNGLKPPYRIRVGQRLKLPQTSSGRETSAAPPVPLAVGPRATIELPARLWLWVLSALVVFWLLGSVCLRVGCWFSLVKASFTRCLGLSLLWDVLLVICLGTIAGLGFLVLRQTVSVAVAGICAAGLLVAYLIGSVMLTKRVLRCQWRSVVTVLVMGKLVADALGVAVMVALFVALPGAMGTEHARELLTGLLNSG